MQKDFPAAETSTNDALAKNVIELSLLGIAIALEAARAIWRRLERLGELASVPPHSDRLALRSGATMTGKA
jgi:hypothetical protein